MDAGAQRRCASSRERRENIHLHGGVTIVTAVLFLRSYGLSMRNWLPYLLMLLGFNAAQVVLIVAALESLLMMVGLRRHRIADDDLD